jgi:hypothetical protein
VDGAGWPASCRPRYANGSGEIDLSTTRLRTGLAALTVATLMSILIPGTALAGPPAGPTIPVPSPAGPDQAQSATAGQTFDGGRVARPKPAPGKPWTQEQMRQMAQDRAIREKQNVYTDSAEVGSRPEPGLSLAPGNDLPTAPLDNDVNECVNAPGAKTSTGRVHNRFLYCRQARFGVEYWKLDDKGVPVELAGITTVLTTQIAYGSKQSRSVRIFLRVEPGSADYDKWGLIDRLTKAPYQHLIINVECLAGLDLPDPRCERGGDYVMKTISEWDDGAGWQHWDITSKKPTVQEGGVDFEWRHQWQFRYEGAALDDFQTVIPGHSVLRTLRCDSATYFRYQGEACVFDDVIPHLTYSTSDTGVSEVAAHIRNAQDTPNDTYPLVSPPRDKIIPGKFDPDDGLKPALHRLPNFDPRYQENQDHKDAACYLDGPADLNDYYRQLGLPAAGKTPVAGQDCDEYPFRITVEGAANPQWDFSVQGVNNSQNRRAGSRLGTYLRQDRILYYNDGFFVDITDGGGPYPEPEPFHVSAGPDLGGNEGQQLSVLGSADDFVDGRLYWSYAAGAGVDPGATCQFSNAGVEQPSVSCTDDGTYTLTLTYDDGTGDLVSDSATLNLRNVEPLIRAPNLAGKAAVPALGIQSPRPWQVFRVGQPVTVTTKYFDPGANDTQMCTVNWDDGTASQSFAGTGDTCTGTRTFTKAGMYTISPGITDDDGGVAAQTSVMVIVYDPAAGVGRGNGWLNSDTTGGFDFTASYPTRASTVPDGSMTFALPASLGVNLRTNQKMDWSVITPNGKIAIKGSAENIPGKKIRFLLYGQYGCPAGQTTGCQPGAHRLRMVVWDSTTYGDIPQGVPALYDNRLVAEFDIDRFEQQAIANGLIVIQHPPIQFGK